MPPRIFSLALSFAFLLSSSIVTTRSIASYINTSVLAFTFFLFWWHIRVAWSLLFDLFRLSTAYYILILFPLSFLATLYTFFFILLNVALLFCGSSFPFLAAFAFFRSLPQGLCWLF
uniref:Uncharacterized protein n=1 Tax=Anopheles coluzzii TaxID=1518534 RepID=A0A6E8W8Z0_ANOCL